MATEGKNTYDTKKYTACAPWYGRRAGYTRRFRPEFIGALHGYADKYATLYDHYMQVDPGAMPAGQPQIPHPGTANSTMRIESELAYAARSKRLFSLIWLHVEDVDIRARLDAVSGDGLAAMGVLDEAGFQPTTGLTQVSQDSAWTNLKLHDVGQTENTIVRFVLLFADLSLPFRYGLPFSTKGSISASKVSSITQIDETRMKMLH